MSDLARVRAELFDEILFPYVSGGGLGAVVEKARALEQAQGQDPWSHYILGLALGMRYLDGKDVADAEGSCHHLEEAIRLGGREDPDAAMFRQQLAGSLGARWANTFAQDPNADPTELAGALRLAREAVEMTGARSPHLPVRLVQVAEFLGQGAEGPGGITEALALAERALAVTHADDPRRSKFEHVRAQLLLRLAATEGSASTAVDAEVSATRAGHLAHPYDSSQVAILGTFRSARILGDKLR
ncbi:hypothetical protein [Nocardiopsis tropica]|uniref:Tetratricopeptide repeat protein n=1 Tax=Nocardiopsis tropica TaxID=109330 RepID=A0ABU7L0U5_9ACTN|nr:hypothetical protein [Nocardiopsis umidischolae]MEE2055144.1 hypothetical protein [Nocardiopsis umidischolae]